MTKIAYSRLYAVFFLIILVLVGCRPDPTSTALRIRVIVDGKELVFSANDRVTILQFLQQANIQLDPLDRVNPPEVTQITDNMVITIIRVSEDQSCDDQDVPYETKYLSDPDLAPGSTKIVQPGVTGKQQVCYSIVYEDGIEKSRTPSNPTITLQPVNEIVARGVDRTKIEPVPVTGTIVYIADGQARAIEGNSTSDRLLQTGGNLDGKVFALSPNGKQLLYTRKPDATSNASANAATSSVSATGTPIPDTYNELWVILDVSDPSVEPVRLKELDNVLVAEWVPDQPFTFSYSTLQPRDQAPGYQALNDVNIARLDSRTGKLLKVHVVVKSKPTGVYGFWGTEFKWSPDGKTLGWAQADGVGIVDLKAGEYKKLFDFRVYATTLSRSWVWIPELTWSPSSDLLAATVHGKPLYGEPEETSPVFDVAIVQANDKVQGLYQLTLVAQAGMWAAPQYSPLTGNATASNGEVKKGYIAYLKARDPIDSATSEYDLVVADRDGSNAHPLFPGADKPGIKPIDNLFGNEIAWSADGRQVAMIYQGNLWVIDVESGRANQVTVVDNAHHPRWGK
jgi:resuscitation-promoting factor RpfB